jgi:hypothetical protein
LVRVKFRVKVRVMTREEVRVKIILGYRVNEKKNI